MQTTIHYTRTGKDFGADWDYVTTATCVFEFDLPHKAVPRDFHNRWLAIDRTYDADGKETITITIPKDYAFDGPSVVPDFPGTVEASLVHDALYQFVDAVAAHFGWLTAHVMYFADNRFYDVMAYLKVPFYISWTYRAGVGAFGFIYNRGAKLFRWITGK